jgi:peptidoglycan/xylan/chitin deacetylase (PgdA/CDA1 family)
MKIFTSWDDGDVWDTKIAVLLKKYNLPGIFYIPTWRDLGEMDIKGLVKDGFEIGGHTHTHSLDLKRLSCGQLIREIFDNKRYLENLINKEITSFCYPRGRYNEQVMQIVKEAGYKEARTTLVGHTDYPENKFKKHTTVHVRSGRKEYKNLSWFDYAIKKLDEAIEKDSYFHLWGHSAEIEEYNQWDKLEEFFKILYDYKNK